MSRSWSRGPRRRYSPPRPRSLWRRLVDYGLTVVLLALLILLAARLDRLQTRQTEGAAIVNDGDSITLGTERIRMRWAVAYGAFETEEAAARAGRAGIWAGTFDEPQDWRASHGHELAERKHG